MTEMNQQMNRCIRVMRHTNSMMNVLSGMNRIAAKNEIAAALFQSGVRMSSAAFNKRFLSAILEWAVNGRNEGGNVAVVDADGMRYKDKDYALFELQENGEKTMLAVCIDR